MCDEEHIAPDATEPSHAEVARQIADQLGETAEVPRQQIMHIVRAMGRTGAKALFAQTLEVEAQGGLMHANGKHRRTVGGIFFHLAYTVGTTKAGEKLWRPKTPKRPGQAKSKQPKPERPTAQANQPVSEPFAWEDRNVVIEAIGDEKGTASTVKITLIGSPGKWQQRGDCTVLVMQHTGEKFPALPKGVPAPAPTKTNYVVYVGAKQWKSVASAAADPEDALIVEGFPQIDQKTGAISVFATALTSKKLQAAKRQAQPAG